jgi:hypothetical protein
LPGSGIENDRDSGARYPSQYRATLMDGARLINAANSIYTEFLDFEFFHDQGVLKSSGAVLFDYHFIFK